MSDKSRERRSLSPLWLGLLLGLGLFTVFGFGENPPPAGGADGPGHDPAPVPHAGRKRRSALLFLSNLLLGVGVLLLLLVGGLYAYNYYEEQRARTDPWLQQLQAVWQQQTPPAAAPALATATATEVAPVEPTAAGGASPSPSSNPAAATPTPRVYPQAVGIRIPSIGVDSRVVEVGIKNGEYEVPKFYVGHYQDTARPGERGNGVYSGHVESAQSGNVFANLARLEVGQDIFLYTEEGIWQYRVSETKTVRNDDLSVMAPTADYRITLITCAGTFNVIERQYSHRLIIVAQLVNVGGPRLPGPQAAE